MDKIPQAYRSPEDESLFKKPTDDPAIRPDRVSPAVEGYFRIPAVWIGKEPDPKSVSILNPQIHHAVVLEKNLSCGIKVRVQRDGTFLFDFSSCPIAPQVVIPLDTEFLIQKAFIKSPQKHPTPKIKPRTMQCLERKL